MRTFKFFSFHFIGIFLIIGLLCFIAYRIYFLQTYESPDILSIGDAFEGNLQLPIEVVMAKINAAHDVMLSKAIIGQNLQWLGEITTWLSFLATAIITLIMGGSGRTIPTNLAQPTKDEMHGFTNKTVRIIGILAALSAIFTATGNLSASQAQIYIKKAETLCNFIRIARSEISKAPTATDAEAVLDDLDIKVRS